MYTLNEIAAWLETFAPRQLAEEWDNVGTLVRCGENVTGVLCALDITPDTVAEAGELGCELIVSHHPVIFHPLRTISQSDVPALLLHSGISAVCMHTNLDAADGGVNDVLAQELGLQNVRAFAKIGRVGTLHKKTLSSRFARDAAKRLGAHVKAADAGHPVQTVAVVGGSGGSFVREALACGADCLVTGEASHHDALDALAGGMTLIAAGHYSTEVCVVPALADRLQAEFPRLSVRCSARGRDPFTYL